MIERYANTRESPFFSFKKCGVIGYLYEDYTGFSVEIEASPVSRWGWSYTRHLNFNTLKEARAAFAKEIEKMEELVNRVSRMYPDGEDGEYNTNEVPDYAIVLVEDIFREKISKVLWDNWYNKGEKCTC